MVQERTLSAPILLPEPFYHLQVVQTYEYVSYSENPYLFIMFFIQTLLMDGRQVVKILLSCL